MEKIKISKIGGREVRDAWVSFASSAISDPSCHCAEAAADAADDLLEQFLIRFEEDENSNDETSEPTTEVN